MIILVRYGSWSNNSLNADGIEQMKNTANILRPYITEDVAIVAGEVNRAIESASIIAGELRQKSPKSYAELYAAEEEGWLPDTAKAYRLFQSLLETTNTIVAVVSREYIESLPLFINENIFEKRTFEEKLYLERGEALLINIKSQEINVIN